VLALIPFFEAGVDITADFQVKWPESEIPLFEPLCEGLFLEGGMCEEKCCFESSGDDVGNDDRFSYKLAKAMIALYKQGMIKYNGTDYHSYNLAKA